MAEFSAFLSASKPGTSPFCRLFQIPSVPGITRGRLLPTTAATCNLVRACIFGIQSSIGKGSEASKGALLLSKIKILLEKN
jgi:hypothetical protein